MHAPITLPITTHLYGLGSERRTPPVYVLLTEHTVCARDLIAAHVRAELARAAQARTSSLALHYLLADDVRTAPPLPTEPMEATEIAHAWAGLTEHRYMLVVDGVACTELDASLTLTERSRVSFVRLLPLIGG